MEQPTPPTIANYMYIPKPNDIPTRDEFLKNCQPVTFWRDEKTQTWKNAPGAQFEIRLPSGRVIPIPNFYATFYDCVRCAPYASQNDFNVIFHRGLIPIQSGLMPSGLVPSGWVPSGLRWICDILTGQWYVQFGMTDMYVHCTEELLWQDNCTLRKRVTYLEDVFEHVRGNTKWMDDVMKLVREMPDTRCVDAQSADKK